MYKTKIIRQIAACVLVLLFVLSNTPKQWLHDLFATHIDCKKAITGDSRNLSKIVPLKFHCQCDHLVVETPFTNTIGSVFSDSLILYSPFTAYLYACFTSDHPVHYDLRGPPMV